MSAALAKGLFFSLIAHVVIFAFVDYGSERGWWKLRVLPAWWRLNAPEIRREVTIDLRNVPKENPKLPDPALTFVEVAPQQATPDAPVDAKFYSSQNSRAANPDTKISSNIPKVEGRQEQVPKTITVPRTAPPKPAEPPPVATVLKPVKVETQPLAPPPGQPQSLAKSETPPKAEAKPAAPKEKGDLEYVKQAARLETRPETAPAPRLDTNSNVQKIEAFAPTPAAAAKQRPRRLAQVQPPDTPMTMVGEKMRQAGGVKRFGVESSLDVRATEFGSYDAAVVAAIQKRWYDLLEERDVPRNQKGKVVLEFKLMADGRIVDMIESESEVSAILGLMCQRAVQDPAPYRRWPEEMRQLFGKDYREVRFTFYYN